MKKKNLGEIMRLMWEKVHPRGAHIKYNDENEILNRFKVLLTDKMSVTNKTIIDYGCGGGFLGKYLLNNFKIKKYIAFDIANRSIEAAKKNCEGFDNAEFNIVKVHDWNFEQYKPDIFCAFACLLHFPNQNYLDRFLVRVNDCGAKNVILEIRNIDTVTKFQDKPYASFQHLVFACVTNPEYIEIHLSNYDLVEKTDHTKAPTNCQILYFKKKKFKKEIEEAVPCS